MLDLHKLFIFLLLNYFFNCFEMFGEEPIIKDNVSGFNDEDQEHGIHESGEPSNQCQCGSSSYFKTINSQILEDQQFFNSYHNRGSDSMNVSYNL